MEEQELDSVNIIDKAKEYTRVRKELAVLKAVNKGSHLFANMFTGVLIGVFGLITLLFASMAAAFYISEMMGNSYSGWIIVTGFYFLIALIVFFFKDNVIEPRVIDSIISKIFKEDQDVRNEKITNDGK